MKILIPDINNFNKEKDITKFNIKIFNILRILIVL
jgi:hypothetical protein